MNWGLPWQAHGQVWQQRPGLPTWPEVPVLEEVGQRGQVKLPPTERGLVLAAGRTGASSAFRLRGGQLNRPEETYYVSSKSWA